MSIEEALAGLTKALERNSDLLESLTNKAKTAAAKAEEQPKAEEKADDAPTKRTRTTAGAAENSDAAPTKRTRATAKSEKVPTEAQMAEATKEFCDVEPEDEYEERRALVKKILAHFGVEKMSHIEPESRNEALGMLEAYKNGDDPFPKKRRRDDDMA